jgi:hypothetical protein
MNKKQRMDELSQDIFEIGVRLYEGGLSIEESIRLDLLRKTKREELRRIERG